MKTLNKIAAAMVLAAAATTASASTSDTQNVTVNVDFQESCAITSAPAAIDFTGSTIGDTPQQDFSVDVECSLTKNMTSGAGVSIYFDPQVLGSNGSTIVVTMQGDALTTGNLLGSSAANVQDGFAGTNTYTFNLTAYVVDDASTLGAPSAYTADTESIVANIGLATGIGGLTGGLGGGVPFGG